MYELPFWGAVIVTSFLNDFDGIRRASEIPFGSNESNVSTANLRSPGTQRGVKCHDILTPRAPASHIHSTKDSTWRGDAGARGVTDSMESLPHLAFFSCYRPGKKRRKEREKEKRKKKKGKGEKEGKKEKLYCFFRAQSSDGWSLCFWCYSILGVISLHHSQLPTLLLTCYLS